MFRFAHCTTERDVGIDIAEKKQVYIIEGLARLEKLHADQEKLYKNGFAEKLEYILRKQTFDVIQLESLYLTPYLPVIRKHSAALVALRAHNVEHEIWERVAENSGLLKKWYLRKITPRLRQYETEHLNDYDLVVGISERDVAQFRMLGLKKNATVTSIGLN